MKTSETIAVLQKMVDTYGDLQFSIAMQIDGKVQTAETIHFGYDQFEEHDEINIRNFPY